MNTKKIIIEEINRSILLMNYNTNKTLTENVISNDTYLLNEQTGKQVLKALFGFSDEAAIAGVKGGASYAKAAAVLGNKSVLAAAGGFKNADDLISALAKGSLKTPQLSGMAKELLKQGQVTGNLRTALVSKAANLSLKDARYIGMEGDEFMRKLIKKGYNPAIARETKNELLVLRGSQKMKKPPTPKDGSDVAQYVDDVPTGVRNSWSGLKKWGVGLGLSALAIAAIWYNYNSDDDVVLPPDPDPVPDPVTTPSRYSACTGTYTLYCKSPQITEVQKCLGFTNVKPYFIDGKFGPTTQKALKDKFPNKNYFTQFTDADVDVICNKTPEPSPAPAPDEITGVEDVLNQQSLNNF
jgi:hypothetical protein